STWKPPSTTHSPITRPGTATNGVSIGMPSSHERPSPEVPRSERIEADASAGKYAWSSAEPPATAAGLTHPAAWPADRGRPKNEPSLGGAVSRKLAQAVTQ